MVDTPTRTVVAGFPDEQAARLATVSLRQLRYWAKDGFMPPSLDLSDRGFPGSRLYSFRDLVCLRVLGQLKNVHRVSLQHLRRTKASLAHLGDDLWAKTTLYVLGRRVVVYNPEAGLTEVVSGQGVMTIPLTVVSGDIEGEIQALRQRRAETVGRIDTKRGGVKNSFFAGTRIPVRKIYDLLQDGETVAEILQMFPSLRSADVELARRYGAAA